MSVAESNVTKTAADVVVTGGLVVVKLEIDPKAVPSLLEAMAQ